MLIVCSADPPVSVQYRKKNRTAKPNARDDMAAQILIKNYSIMKNLQGMKNFSSLENKKLKNMQAIHGGDDSARTSSQSSSGGNSSDTVYYKDGIKTMTLHIEGPNPTNPY